MLRRAFSIGLALAMFVALSAQANAQRPRRERGDRVAPPPAVRPPVEAPVNPPTTPVEPAPPARPNDTTAARGNTHTGWFVRTEGDNKFVMRGKDGSTHTHVLARKASVTCDGKSCKLSDLRKGEFVRVTSRPGDTKTVVRVDARKAPTDREDTNVAPPRDRVPARDTAPPPPAPAPRRERRR